MMLPICTFHLYMSSPYVTLPLNIPASMLISPFMLPIPICYLSHVSLQIYVTFPLCYLSPPVPFMLSFSSPSVSHICYLSPPYHTRPPYVTFFPMFPNICYLSTPIPNIWCLSNSYICYLSHPFQIYYLHKCHLIQPPLWLVCYPSICDLFPQCFLSPPPLMARTCFLCVTRMLPDYLLHYLLPVPSVCYLAASCVYLLIVSGYVS